MLGLAVTVGAIFIFSKLCERVPMLRYFQQDIDLHF